MKPQLKSAILSSHQSNHTLFVRLGGDWVIENRLPDKEKLFDELARQTPAAIQIDGTGLSDWDSGLVTLLVKLHRFARDKGVQITDDGLPDGAHRLVELAFAVEERAGARRETVNKGLLTLTGEQTVKIWSSVLSALAFLGSVVLSFGRFFTGRANYQRQDLWVAIQETGVEALPIVSLIAFLAGVILAFVGVVQLNQFGAGIYVADLVAIGVVREMGALMAGIIMAGRTGAAFAAQLGTMQVNEEIDALSTMGVEPIDFLVLPKIIALILMMPLLAVYANFLGILGGATVSLSILDASIYQYFVQTVDAVSLADFAGGVIKATVYGILVALAGCRCGMLCGTSAAAVGQATTAAVVTGIVLIVVSNAVLNVIYTILDF